MMVVAGGSGGLLALVSLSIQVMSCMSCSGDEGSPSANAGDGGGNVADGGSSGDDGGRILPPPPPPPIAITSCVAGKGKDYQVGDGAGQLASLDLVPWESLAPGDTVRI